MRRGGRGLFRMGPARRLTRVPAPAAPVSGAQFGTSERGVFIRNGACGITTVPETAPTGDLALARMVLHFALIEPIFDTMADVVFFVKDAQARYVLANRTLASRCGLGNKRDLLGKTAEQVFPARFGRI